MMRRVLFALSLAAATIFSANAAVVRGVVEDNATNPNPIQGAIVSFSLTGGDVYKDTTDADGGYRVTINTNGTYAIDVTKTGYTPDPNNDPTVRITGTTGTLIVDFVMVVKSSGAIVQGTVTDSITNAYLIGAKLFLQQSAFNGYRTIDSTTSGSSGAYKFDSVTSGTYRIQASLSRYLSKTASLTVRTEPDTVDFKLVPVEIAKISGTTTDSLSNANLAGVKLILQQMATGGWRTVDSTTSASGAYTFDSVTAGTYRIQASLTGYIAITTGNITVSGTQSQTKNIKLLGTQTGKITGKVTYDSANGGPIANVRLILEKVTTTTEVVDTEFTDSNGVYLFTHVETGLNYDITTFKTGYWEYTIRHNRQSAGTDTVNFKIDKFPVGNFYIISVKQADSTPIVGASVTATVNRTDVAPVIATTNSKGIAVFENIITGTYSIVITAGGFVPVNRTNISLASNAMDTLRFFMTAATSGTKVLVGTVTDSASKAFLASVRIALTIQSGGITYNMVDSTDATGKFIIPGIPVSVYLGSVAATRTSYRNFSNTQVTIGQPNLADTGRLNIIMVKLPTDIHPRAALSNVAGTPEISVAGAARVSLRNFNKNDVATIFNMNGKIVYRTKIASSSVLLVLPETVTSGSYIVTVTQRNAVYRQQVIMP